MNCGKCGSGNDEDARYCEQCGQELISTSAPRADKKKPFFLALLVVLVVSGVAAVGYYKFFLPSGIAAVVNGEEISLAEVDAQMQGYGRSRDIPEELRGRMRYRILNDLITERIACQDARKAGVRVTGADIDAAHERIAAGSGGRAQFDAAMKTQYGSMRAFRRSLERSLIIRKYIDEKVAAGVSDPAAADLMVSAWLRGISDRASVRVALAEQLPGAGAGCSGGCCGKEGNGASPQITAAREAALAYWRSMHGDVEVEARVRDRGCHVEIDMLKGTTVTASLRYQNGVITEQ